MYHNDLGRMAFRFPITGPVYFFSEGAPQIFHCINDFDSTNYIAVYLQVSRYLLFYSIQGIFPSYYLSLVYHIFFLYIHLCTYLQQTLLTLLGLVRPNFTRILGKSNREIQQEFPPNYIGGGSNKTTNDKYSIYQNQMDKAPTFLFIIRSFIRQSSYFSRQMEPKPDKSSMPQ